MKENINKIKIHERGRILYSNNRYLDQIDGVTYISSNYMSRYLINKYGITSQEYYNLIMYGNTSNTPKCFRCGKPREFIKISHGYKSRCHECLIKSHKRIRKEYKEGTKSYTISIISKKRVKDGSHNFINQPKIERINAQLSSGKETFINRAKLRGITEAFLYCGITQDNNIKIGITFVGIKRRAKVLKLKTVHLLMKGTPEFISNIEYSLKVKFLNIESSNNEVFPFETFKDIIKFLKLNKV